MEIRVGPGRRYPAHTLMEAVQRPGVTRIVLAPGVHRAGGVTVPRPVTIAGEPGAELEAAVAVRGDVTLADLTIRGTVRVSPGCTLALTGCRITAASGYAVYLAQNSRGSVYDTEILGTAERDATVMVEPAAEFLMEGGA